MSGFEIAGVVLGALPVIIAAVDLLRDAKQKTLIPFRKRHHVARLANALLLQKQTIAETIRLLSVHSGCASHDDGDLSRLDDDPLGYLEDEDVKAQILDFLGDKNHAALTGALQESSRVVKRVAKQLAGLVPSRQNEPDDLLGIIEANRSAKQHQADLLPRFKLMIGSSDLKKSIEDLDAASNSLDRFSRLVLMNRSTSTTTDSSRKSRTVRLAKALRQVRGFANDLYTALCQCCQAGTCHSKHEANLFLEDRVDAADDILRSMRQQKTDQAAALIFRLIFAATLLAPPQQWWHELPIQVLKDTRDTTFEPASLTSRTRFVVPDNATTGDITSAMAALTLVDDFCSTIITARSRNPAVAFVVSRGRKMGTITADKCTILSQVEPKRISLKTILSDSGSVADGIGFSLRFRMLLALRLASSLLQLSQTRWLGHAWSKEMVYFLMQPMPNGGKESVDFSRVFVTAPIDTQAPPQGSSPEPKLMLLELGILLLEIWHQTTLEARFSLGKPPDGYYQRLARAVEWLEDNSNPPPCLYENAVSYCIRGMLGGQVRLTTWDANDFWNWACQDIIEPLSQNCKQWR
ncbi:hypothetical protein B0H63DRAFT_427002 [Podospora didyma]|uniref:DUF7580 domain-containing protein n=1 Tax=Podospora didyma TaxID=330526 RepID=A0AAE0P7X2_9PEZI|nr:hypothetical protein B0H63DRAFT_427002 [Podospora didyma]